MSSQYSVISIFRLVDTFLGSPILSILTGLHCTLLYIVTIDVSFHNTMLGAMANADLELGRIAFVQDTHSSFLKPHHNSVPIPPSTATTAEEPHQRQRVIKKPSNGSEGETEVSLTASLFRPRIESTHYVNDVSVDRGDHGAKGTKYIITCQGPVNASRPPTEKYR